ncbi:hypothetical protein HKT28_24275, partial [Pseudomonas aeruginosa]|nr:hypothetical protein [Pseudomonas aeruginosa]
MSAPGRSRAGRELDLAAELFGATQPALALFHLSVDVVEFAGYEWSKGRIGRD